MKTTAYTLASVLIGLIGLMFLATAQAQAPMPGDLGNSSAQAALIGILNQPQFAGVWVLGLISIGGLAVAATITPENPLGTAIQCTVVLVIMTGLTFGTYKLIKSDARENAEAQASALLDPKTTLKLFDGQTLMLSVPGGSRPPEELLGREIEVVTTPKTLIIQGKALEDLRKSSIRLAGGTPANILLANLH
jgi:hypothetical protein